MKFSAVDNSNNKRTVVAFIDRDGELWVNDTFGNIWLFENDGTISGKPTEFWNDYIKTAQKVFYEGDSVQITF